jgi:hypothetical protein
MTQELLALDHSGTDTVEDAGFQIGWDHAHHGLVPPPGLLLEGTPISAGWRAGKAVFGGRTLSATRAVRQWLALRTEAWRQGIAFETQQLGAHLLQQMEATHCPVLRCRLGGAERSAARFERLNPDAGFAAGNVAQISAEAASLRHALPLAEAVRRARLAETSAAPVAGHDAGVWWRLAALRSFSTTLPFAEAARLPLALLPPNRVRLLNAVQGLQAWLSMQFVHPGWGTRLQEVARLLPEHTLRHDFNLWVGALVPRVLQAPQQIKPLRHVIEDAWLAERVQRRWQHFVLSLGEAGVAHLLERVLALPLPGAATLWHEPASATEGWALESRGRLSDDATAPPAPAPARPPARRRTDRSPRGPVLRATAARPA